MYVYRVTRERRKPQYYKSATSATIHTARSVKAILKFMDELERTALRLGHERPRESVTMIERAEVGEFVEISDASEIL